MTDQRWDDADARFDAELRRELGRPARVDPAAMGRIMAEVRATSRGTRRGASLRDLWAWMFDARPVAVSPFGLLAAASLVAVAAVAVARGTAGREPASVAAAPAPSAPPATPVHQASSSSSGGAAGSVQQVQQVQFVFVNPGASSVSVVGDFNDWDLGATPLRRTGSGGIWSVVVPLPAGEHHYSYVVDGKTWVPDATAPQAPAGEFGGTNSVMFVGGRS